MTIYNWLCILGVQALVTTSISMVVSIVNNSIQKRMEKNSANQNDQRLIKSAMQVSLRKDLYEMYTIAVNNQSVTLEEQKLFLSLYAAYHSLGENGVMDEIKKQYMNIKVIN